MNGLKVKFRLNCQSGEDFVLNQNIDKLTNSNYSIVTPGNLPLITDLVLHSQGLASRHLNDIIANPIDNCGLLCERLSHTANQVSEKKHLLTMLINATNSSFIFLNNFTRQQIERKRKLSAHRTNFIRHLKLLQNLDLPFDQSKSFALCSS